FRGRNRLGRVLGTQLLNLTRPSIALKSAPRVERKALIPQRDSDRFKVRDRADDVAHAHVLPPCLPRPAGERTPGLVDAAGADVLQLRRRFGHLSRLHGIIGNHGTIWFTRPGVAWRRPSMPQTTITLLGSAAVLPGAGQDTACFLINGRVLFDTGWYAALKTQ